MLRVDVIFAPVHHNLLVVGPTLDGTQGIPSRPQILILLNPYPPKVATEATFRSAYHSYFVAYLVYEFVL